MQFQAPQAQQYLNIHNDTHKKMDVTEKKTWRMYRKNPPRFADFSSHKLHFLFLLRK